MQALDTCGSRVQMLRGRVLWRSRHLAIHMWMASHTNITPHAGHGNVLEGGTRPSLERVVVVLVKRMYNDWLQGLATS